METKAYMHPAHGFTLVEVMVGMVIGMIGMIVMMQVFLVSDASKRISSGGGDAQTNGTGALYALQRDLRQSGNGISQNGNDISVQSLMGCSLALPSGATLALLAPVQVNAAQIPAGDAATDTLLIAYGSGAGSPDGDVIVSQPSTPTYVVTVPLSFKVSEWVVALPSSMAPCALTLEQVQVRSIGSEVTVTAGVTNATGGILFNLGPAPRVLAYAVRGGKLTVCDFMVADCSNSSLISDPTVWVVLASNIVSMRVQYGRDTTAAMDVMVDTFDQVTPGSPADKSGLPVRCAVARVLAVRLVLVARSGTFEKTEVTSIAPVWAGSATTPVDLSALPAWKNYRYKSFQNLVPLRNRLTAGVPKGC